MIVVVREVVYLVLAVVQEGGRSMAAGVSRGDSGVTTQHSSSPLTTTPQPCDP